MLGLPVAFALAWVLARGRFWGRFALEIAVDLPLVLPPVVTGWALLTLFGRGGWLAPIGGLFVFRWTGAALAAGIMALPLMVRAIRLALEAADRRLEAAAASLGASRLRVFRSVTLPLAAPGVIAGAVVGFAKALGEFGATITFVASIPGETRTLPLAIYGALQTPGSEAAVVRLALLSAALSVGALVVAEIFSRRAKAHRR
jgi:molybdate transport system permease protein